MLGNVGGNLCGGSDSYSYTSTRLVKRYKVQCSARSDITLAYSGKSTFMNAVPYTNLMLLRLMAGKKLLVFQFIHKHHIASY